ITGSWEGKFIRRKVISGKNIKVPCERIPAGIYISLSGDPRNQPPVLSSDESAARGETAI
ncbi:hypothetical protein BDR05DRAFT_971501, partial [Suillus weaverae]